MKRCPKCRRASVRCHVSLFLDIPAELMHQLSKQALRRRDVQVLGAGWPTCTLLCTKCRWFMRFDGSSEPSSGGEK